MWWNPRSSQNERAAARLPDGIRIYAIGDIHGRADLLESLLLQIDEDCGLYPSRRPIVVFIGDYIDRGPASREVLDLLLGYERTKETIFLRGNHETFVHRFLSKPAVLMNGDSTAVSKLLCPMGLSLRLIRAHLRELGWPKNWPCL